MRLLGLTSRGSLRLCAAGLALVFSASCAPVLGGLDDSGAVRRVFEVAYDNLSQRYIEPLDARRVAVAGLGALERLDPALDIKADGTRVRILRDKVPVGILPAPADDDVDGWAELSATAVKLVRSASPELRGRDLDAVTDAMLRGAVSGLDKYSRYAAAAAARRGRAARDGFGGIGVSIRLEAGHTEIVKVHPDTPAQKAGLRPGDIVTRVDGVPLGDRDQDDVVDRLRGRVGSATRLTISRPGAPAPLEFELVRARIVLPTVIASQDGGTLELRVTSFNQGTATAVRKAINRARRRYGHELDGAVLDLRGNPGGLLDQAVSLSDLFLTGGRIISTVGRHPDSFQIFDAHRRDLLEGAPLAVLVNGRSASSAEIVAVALRDRGRAVVLGSASFGKGTVQTIIGLPNGGELVLTWARLMAPSGMTLQGNGVVPALCTSLDGGPQAILAGLGRGGEGYLLEHLAGPRPVGGDPAAARAACPPSDVERDGDLDLARRLIADRHLYRQVLARSRPAVAEWPVEAAPTFTSPVLRP